MKIKNATTRKVRNRGLTPIRYHDGSGYRHGWIVQEGARGTLTIRLIGDERNRRLSRDEVRYVTQL
jgi:hypothetical protein